MEFDDGAMTLLPFGLPGKIYRSPMPFRSGEQEDRLYKAYQQAEIQVVVVLADSEECQRKTGRDLLKFYHEQGMRVIHCPIQDYGVPGSPSALHDAIRATLRAARDGEAVAVHCNAGLGRTGIFLGCMARQHLGISGQEAVSWVREFVPWALENQAQVQYVNDYEMIK